MKRSGTADLPLHYGKVPPWLSSRMAELGRGIISAIVADYGTPEVVRRLADPFWFQALGCVMGMDWHSSGITTSVMGALKAAINPISHELGVSICGGRGKHSLRTPDELIALADKTGLDGPGLVRASKLSAKVDNTCVLDGFGLYLHSFIVSHTGDWAVVQQGMNTATHMARRYHWHSASVKSFVDDPHVGIIGENIGAIVNLADSRADKSRSGIVDFVSHDPASQVREMRSLVMARPHQIKPEHVDSRRLGAVLTLAHEKNYSDFVDVLLLPGVGPRTIQSLALVSEVIYGAPSRFSDPARFAFAHGGKDGAPFPVPLKVYDESIAVLQDAVAKAKINQTEKLRGLRMLETMSQQIEKRCDPFADVEKVIRHEWRQSYRYGGMTIKGPVAKPEPVQLSLFD
jgi:hypothetical protein